MSDEITLLTENKKPTKDWNENDWNKFHDWLVGMLHVTPMTITFTKKDGSKRIMNCTLKSDLLPKIEIKEDKQPRKKSTNTVSVYDLEAKGWRSFTLKNVTNVQCIITVDK